MKRLILVIVLCVLPLLTDGETVEEFSIDKHFAFLKERKINYLENAEFSQINFIQYLMLKDVPEEYIPYILVQAQYESEHFKSSLFKRANNLVGMKFPIIRETTAINWTYGDVGGKAKMSVYSKWQDSAKDYLLWLNMHKNKDKTDYIKFLEDANYCELKSKYSSDIREMVKYKKTNEIITKAKGSLYVL